MSPAPLPPLRLLLAFACVLAASIPARAQTPATLYQTVEESLAFDTSFASQPFNDIDLDLEVEAPDRRVPAARFAWFGFYDGDGRGGQKGDVWKYRLHLDAPGRWTVTATFRRVGEPEPLAPPRTFAYEVAPTPAPGEHGHVTRDPRNPRRLAFADGRPWVPFPIHSSFLLDQTRGTAERWLDAHAALGVNALSVRFHAEAANALGVPGHWHFLAADGTRLQKWPGRDGAETGFDYTRPDLASWRHNEAILTEAYRRGIRLNIWFGLSGDNRQYRSYGPNDWIKDGELGPQQRRFIRYFLARWAPLPVWWHWTVDSEYEEGPGDDLARDRAWAAELQRLNPWPTLITTHVLRQWTPRTAPEYDLATLQLRVPADPARVVSDSADFVRQTLPFGLPVYNAEGVWMLPSTATRLGTLAHLFAGGYSHVAHDASDDGPGHRTSSWGCDWDHVNPRHRDDAATLGALARFFNTPAHAALNRTRPAPELVTLEGGRNALCLAAPGEAYYLWLDEGGSATLDLSDAPGRYSLTRHTGPDFADSAVEFDPVAGGAALMLPAAPQSGFGRDTLYVLRAAPSDRAAPAAARAASAAPPAADHEAPRLTLRAPAADAVVGPDFLVLGNATDTSGIARVEGRLVGETEWRPATGRAAWSLGFGPLASGPHTLEFRAVDLASGPNISAPTVHQVTVDADAPIITELVARREAKRLVVTWRTDELASSRVQWGPSPGIYEGESGVVAEGVTSHRVVLPLPAGTVHLIAISADAYGNTAISAEQTLAANP
jgi:hypothetical protein